jgi:N-acyl-D-aspartate/D-glutamate deacylase
MTGAPAARLGLPDRGLLRERYKADVVIFDPARVMDRATFADPHQYPEGIEHVFVNGQLTLGPEGHTGVLAGRALTRG